MKEYFILQYRLTNRKLKDSGLHPFVGYTLIVAVFIGLSFYLFYKTKFAEYILILYSLSITLRLSEIKRNDFLKMCFGKRIAILRIMENLAISIPFAAFLMLWQCFFSVAILFSINILMALINFRTSFNLTIPTPFYKKPFEFTVGFRNTFYLLAIAYCLSIVAIFVNNFNLGIFSLLLVFFITYYYYLKPENEYYVWIYNLTPMHFLLEKIKTGFIFSSMIGLPIMLLLGLCFADIIFPSLVFFALGLVFLLTVILMKYSAYPDEINIPQVILLALTFVFPPMLIIIIPTFLNQSIKHLSKFLK